MRAMTRAPQRQRATRARPHRTVVIGDLNGADDALVDILRGTGLIDARHRWVGGSAELVQMGDLFNRGHGARRAFEILLRLEREAKREGGRVVVLMGNHEAMTMLGNEAYCSEGEYLSFATAAERRAWPARVKRALRRIYGSERRRGVVLPFEPRLEVWKALNVPGRTALRKELGPRGKLGKALRALPVVHHSGGAVFVHAGLLPKWAALGVDGVNRAARAELADERRRFLHFSANSMFRNPSSPLWDRSLTAPGREASTNLARSLRAIGAQRMIVGHTPTDHIKGGQLGRILTLHGGRLVAVDVGLNHGAEAPRAALIIEGPRGVEWTPEGVRTLWRDQAR